MKTLLDVKVRRGADIDSDHHLVIGEFRMKLAAKRFVGGGDRKRFNTLRMKDREVRDEVTVALRNRFAALVEEEVDGEDVDIMWHHCKKILTDTCKEVLGYREAKTREWISEDTWRGIEARREVKQNLCRETNMVKKRELQGVYKRRRKEVKQDVKRNKKKWMEDQVQQAEEAATAHNVRELYNLTKRMAGKTTCNTTPVRDKDGKLL